MQRDVKLSSLDGVRVPCERDAQASQREAIEETGARSADQVGQQRSPGSRHCMHQLRNQEINSSDDDSGGLDYETDGSAVRDYMDNVAEQDQGCDSSSIN